jgi:hypothetical protein
MTTDKVQVSLLPGDTFTGFFGIGLPAMMILLTGGMIIGFGTRMSGGGYTSSQGLNGCGRLQVASMTATAAFFGTGILVSWMMELVL